MTSEALFNNKRIDPLFVFTSISVFPMHLNWFFWSNIILAFVMFCEQKKKMWTKDSIGKIIKKKCESGAWCDFKYHDCSRRCSRDILHSTIWLRHKGNDVSMWKRRTTFIIPKKKGSKKYRKEYHWMVGWLDDASTAIDVQFCGIPIRCLSLFFSGICVLCFFYV